VTAADTPMLQSCNTYTRIRSMPVMEGPIQLDERTEEGALTKDSDAYMLLGNGLGSVV
jgi:hypothetical protein